MNKREGIGKVSFLCICIIIADATILGALLAHIIDPERCSNLRDPTYAEALQFIGSDETDRNQYNQSYICTNFATDLMNNAFTARYRCGYVTIEFPDISHAIVCFNTSDYGLVFIEPQNDQIVALATGKSYLDKMVLGFTTMWTGSSEYQIMLILCFAFLPPSIMGALQPLENWRKNIRARAQFST